MPESWESERLLARAPLAEDLAGYRELLGDEAVVHWLQSPPRRPFGEAQVHEWHGGDIAHWREHGFGVWVLLERESGAMVGRGGIHWIDFAGGRIVELAWAVGSAHWGLGFATELAAAAVEWAVELGHGGAVAMVEPANIASLRVAEKVGLRRGEEVEYDGVPHLVYRIDA